MSDDRGELVRWSAKGDVEDESLARLSARMGHAFGVPDADAAPVDRNHPFDLRVVRPRAIDVRALYAANNKPVPAMLAADAKKQRPILLSQAMTPFFPNGKAPRAIWGMGYEIAIDGGVADTESVEPGAQYYKVGQIDQKVDLGLSVGGKLGEAPPSTQPAVAPAGLLPYHAEIRASTDQSLGLSIHFELSFVEVQAGAFDAGGAKWNFYRQSQRLDKSQPLLQTILVREELDKIHVRIKTWIRTPGFLFGLGKPQQWDSGEIEYDVDLR